MSCETIVAMLGFTFLALQMNHNTTLIANQIEALRNDIRSQFARRDE